MRTRIKMLLVKMLFEVLCVSEHIMSHAVSYSPSLCSVPTEVSVAVVDVDVVAVVVETAPDQWPHGPIEGMKET